MKKLCLAVLGIVLLTGHAMASNLEYFKVYTPKQGMSADEIMNIEYFVKYTKFAHDASFYGKAYFIDKSGSVRERETTRLRITLGRKSDDIAYKDLVMFTAPAQVKGLATLTWTYMNPKKEQDTWLWVPSLKKIRKISAANADDSFMGSDFTNEDILTRRFEDEAYTLLREENFKGYHCDFTKKTYYQDAPCFVIEAKPKRSPWYYSKRILWVDKATGAGIYEEMYDPNGKLFKIIFKKFQVYNVNGKEYPAQELLEGKDLRTGHRTVITNEDIRFDIGIPEDQLTEQKLMQSRW
ncbi:MAG: outer membrane lipoprotein-sorting protein [Candidatus Omnitrophica bacterium]|nr:outer membrane lipoprotein-sorting protein [Candidatus Omnitrophota bacterium]